MKKKPDNKETSITRSSAAEYLTFVTARGEGGVEAVYADERRLAQPEDDGELFTTSTSGPSTTT